MFEEMAKEAGGPNAKLPADYIRNGGPHIGGGVPAIKAARAVDAYSCIDSHVAGQSDITSAYTQAFLPGTETWVSLPPERWPRSWRGRFKAPVVKLVLNIYGHPEAGKTWGEAFEKHALECGFEKLQK